MKKAVDVLVWGVLLFLAILMWSLFVINHIYGVIGTIFFVGAIFFIEVSDINDNLSEIKDELFWSRKEAKK